MSITATERLFSIALLLVLFTYALADCGCGTRCQKYTNELQCGRCCTATVRRSASLQTVDENGAENLESTRRRSLEEIMTIVSFIKRKERRSSSQRVRSELQRTRKRLEKYSQLRYGDLIDENSEKDVQLNQDEREMYDVLERIISRLVQQHQTDQDSEEARLEKRSTFGQTSDQRLSQLFKL